MLVPFSIKGVLAAVQLDHEAGRRDGEVGYVGSDGMLAPDSDVTDFGTKRPPQDLLNIG
jgi:hypothetical protein